MFCRQCGAETFGSQRTCLCGGTRFTRLPPAHAPKIPTVEDIVRIQREASDEVREEARAELRAMGFLHLPEPPVGPLVQEHRRGLTAADRRFLRSVRIKAF